MSDHPLRDFSRVHTDGEGSPRRRGRGQRAVSAKRRAEPSAALEALEGERWSEDAAGEQRGASDLLSGFGLGDSLGNDLGDIAGERVERPSDDLVRLARQHAGDGVSRDGTGVDGLGLDEMGLDGMGLEDGTALDEVDRNDGAADPRDRDDGPPGDGGLDASAPLEELEPELSRDPSADTSALERAVAQAVAARDAEGFFDELLEQLQSARRGAGRGRGVSPLLPELMPILRAYSEEFVSEHEGRSDLATRFIEDDLDEVLPVLAGLAVRALLEPQRGRGRGLTEAARLELVRGAADAARTLVATRGRRGVLSLPNVLRSAAREVVRQRRGVDALPGELRDVASRVPAALPAGGPRRAPASAARPSRDAALLRDSSGARHSAAPREPASSREPAPPREAVLTLDAVAPRDASSARDGDPERPVARSGPRRIRVNGPIDIIIHER